MSDSSFELSQQRPTRRPLLRKVTGVKVLRNPAVETKQTAIFASTTKTQPAVPISPTVPARGDADRLHVLNHPAAKQALLTLCRRSTEQYEFRVTSNQLLMLLAMEATRSIPVEEQTVETSVGNWNGEAMSKSVVFVSLDKPGLGLLHTLSESFSGILVASIGSERAGSSHAPEPRLNLTSIPALSRSRVILFAPMIANSDYTAMALNLLQRLGATDVGVASFLMSAQSVFRLKGDFPAVDLWSAGVETKWDGRKETSHTLADFGERFFA